MHYIDAAIDSPICDVIDFLPTPRVILEKKVHFFLLVLFEQITISTTERTIL